MILFQLSALSAVAFLLVELALHYMTKTDGREFFGKGEDAAIARIS